MAREFQVGAPQQLYEEPKPYTPKANALAQADEQFIGALDSKITTQYKTLSDQYERRQISDAEYANQLEFIVSSSSENRIQEKWSPVVTQAKYTVFSNSQAIEDNTVQTDLSNGVISAEEAAARYEAMANAALGQNSQSAVRDASIWNLKAAQIREQARNSGGGGNGDSLSAMDLFALQTGIDELDYLHADALDGQEFADKALADQAFWDDMIAKGSSLADVEKAKKTIITDASTRWDNYYTATSGLATNKLFYKYYNTSPEAATGILNKNLGQIHNAGGKAFVPSVYHIQSPKEQSQTPKKRTEVPFPKSWTVKPQEQVKTEIQGGDLTNTLIKQKGTLTPKIPAKKVSFETQRQSSPLSIGAV